MFIPLIAALLLFNACGSPEKNKETENDEVQEAHRIGKLDWILGDWIGGEGGGTLLESWKRIDDSTFHGTGLFIQGQDTGISEDLRLLERNGEIYYLPTVSNQNDGKEIQYVMSGMEEGIVVFSNSEHDFPNQIRYERVHSDSIVASISGLVNGKTERILFPLSRRKN